MCEFYTNITDFVQNILKIFPVRWQNEANGCMWEGGACKRLTPSKTASNYSEEVAHRWSIFLCICSRRSLRRWPPDATCPLEPPTWRTVCILPWKSLHTFQMKREASSRPRRWISNSSRVESGAPGRSRRPARRQPVLRPAAWSRGGPRPPTGQAGKTPLWIPPRCPEATWTRRACPAVPPCRRTPEGGPSVECGGAESAGPTRAGRTVGAEIRVRVRVRVTWTPATQSFSCGDQHRAQKKCKQQHPESPKAHRLFTTFKGTFKAAPAQKSNNAKGKWANPGRDVTLSAIFSFRNGLMIAKMPLKIRGSFMMLTALILMGNPSCELQSETEPSRAARRFPSPLCWLITGLFIAGRDKTANSSQRRQQLLPLLPCWVFEFKNT